MFSIRDEWDAALNLTLPKPVLFHLDEHGSINLGVVPSYRPLLGR